MIIDPSLCFEHKYVGFQLFSTGCAKYKITSTVIATSSKVANNCKVARKEY